MPASISFMSGVACYSKKSGPRIVIGDKPVCIIMSSIRDVGYGWARWAGGQLPTQVLEDQLTLSSQLEGDAQNL